MNKKMIGARIKAIFTVQNIVFFLALYFLYIFRTPDDLFSPYLWAEDGQVLISGSIYDGFFAIFQTSNGTYWVLQRLLALFCYFVSIPFGNITCLPYIQMFVFKAVAVLGISYFLADRFSWIVSQRLFRFFICAAVILMIPDGTVDVLTCDTSLPFVLFFDVFLIGLDLLCAKEPKKLSIPQTAFLAVISLSYAGGVFAGIVSVLIVLRWIIYKIRARSSFYWRAFFAELIKLSVIMAAVLIQAHSLMSGDRVSADVDILNRLAANTKAFVFFPYWADQYAWRYFLIGLVLWVVIILLARPSGRVTLYCAVFSWSYMLYCSFSEAVDEFYPVKIRLNDMIVSRADDTPRYYLISVMLAAFMLGYAACCMMEKSGGRRKVGICRKVVAMVLVVACIAVSVKTYKMSALGAEYIADFELYDDMYDKNGTEALSVPIGPFNPWVVRFPICFTEDVIEDLEFGITLTHARSVYVSNISNNTLPLMISDGKFDYFDSITGWTCTEDDDTFVRLLIKTGEGEYRAANTIDGEEFNLFLRNNEIDPELDFAGTIELFGQTADGQWHYGTLDVEIVPYDW